MDSDRGLNCQLPIGEEIFRVGRLEIAPVVEQFVPVQRRQECSQVLAGGIDEDLKRKQVLVVRGFEQQHPPWRVDLGGMRPIVVQLQQKRLVGVQVTPRTHQIPVGDDELPRLEAEFAELFYLDFFVQHLEAPLSCEKKRLTVAGCARCVWVISPVPGMMSWLRASSGLWKKHCAGIEGDVLLSGNNISVNHTAIEYPGVCV